MHMMAYEARLQKAMNDKDDDAALCRSLDEMIADSNKEVQAQGGMIKFRWLMSKDKAFEAYDVAKTLIAGPLKDDSDSLNSLAWFIVDPAGKLENKNLDVALSAATRSVDNSEELGELGYPGSRLLLAGRQGEGHRHEKEAISIATKADKADLEKTLKEYQAK